MNIPTMQSIIFSTIYLNWPLVKFIDIYAHLNVLFSLLDMHAAEK